MAGKTYKQLTQDDADFFLAHGYVVVKEAFSKTQADAFTRDLWVRLGLDPHDPSTWDRERIHMPSHTRVPVAQFAPKAWNAITDLLGGEDRIDASSSAWGDSFIVNLGPPPSTPSVFAPSFTSPPFPPPTSPQAPAPAPAETRYPDPRELANWHVDGDFFTHFLDSPEQALLVVPLFSPVLHHGGATFIAPDGIPVLARYLAAHPEGVLPKKLAFVSSLSPHASHAPEDTPPQDIPQDPSHDPSFYSHTATARDHCTHFVELTGAIGDVVLMHPLMLHTASPNALPLPHRPPRIITNPPVALKQPFRFARADAPGDEYSLVERTTLRALGVEVGERARGGGGEEEEERARGGGGEEEEEGSRGRGGYEFAITQPRKTVVPARVALQAQMLEEEKRRLAAHRAELALALSQSEFTQPAIPHVDSDEPAEAGAGLGAARPIAVV